MKSNVAWNGRSGRKVDLKKLIKSKRKKSIIFREAYDAARLATEVSRALARLREESGLSQKELAERLGTSQAAVSRLESQGYAGHSVRMLVRYAEALGHTVAITFHVFGRRAPKGRPTARRAA